MFARNQFFDGTAVEERERPLPVRRERPHPRMEPVDHEAARSCELGRWLEQRRRERGERGERGEVLGVRGRKTED
jgi:hypothetical protein